MTAEENTSSVDAPAEDDTSSVDDQRSTGDLERTSPRSDAGASDEVRPPGSPPPDAPDDPAVCAYCGARFVDERLLALHRGLEHGPELDDSEREAYADAVADERDDLRLFRLQALAALLVIYFGFIFVYAFVL